PGTPSLSTSFCRMIFTAAPASPGAGAERQQCHLARVLHGGRHVALVLRTVSRHPSRPDLAAFGHELLEQPHVLEVDVVDPLLAEDADLALLLLLPALVVLFLLRPSLGLSRHPAVSPLLLQLPPPRARRPSRRRPRRSGPASRPWRSPT